MVVQEIIELQFIFGRALGTRLDCIEIEARKSLAQATSAFNYLEDEPYSGQIHQHAHNIANIVCGLFRCQIKFDSDENMYLDNCTLSMMHHRWGISAGFTSVRNCSICRENIDYCAHLIDTMYSVTVERVDGKCSACGSDSCQHVDGESVEMYPHAVMADMDFKEVSFVRRPRDPLARPTELEIHAEWFRKLEIDVKNGGHVECRRCLGSCVGLYDPWQFSDEPGELMTARSLGMLRS